MKKVISLVLICSIFILSANSVFPADVFEEKDNYNLDELFIEYEEKTLAEMVRFISDNPCAYNFLDFLRENSNGYNFMFYIHTTGVLTSSKAPNLENIGISNNNSSKYLISTARVVNSDSSIFDVLLGEIGNKVMTVEVNSLFVEYINSLDRVERNRFTLNFLMNIIGNEEVTGISWNRDNLIYGDLNTDIEQSVIVGDCNGDGKINSIDGYLMKSLMVSRAYSDIDPFAVDMNGDGIITAKDSLSLRRKLAAG